MTTFTLCTPLVHHRCKGKMHFIKVLPRKTALHIYLDLLNIFSLLVEAEQCAQISL